MKNSRLPVIGSVVSVLLLGSSLSVAAQATSAITVEAAGKEGKGLSNSISAGSLTAPVSQVSEKWAQEPLRDPFWPVGYFPPDWQQKTSFQSEPDLDGSGWKAASGKIRISGTSQLDGRAAAIINGELKRIGEQIDVLHEGKTYQWQIVGIDAEGRIQLKKLGIR
ncbi:MAG TPA: hypothetical protein PLD51_00770 [Pontiellaceae bacterium]|nr:hypothetical protein [Pontiellaceae bacterium]HPR82364.1 hypothetical protein [Pontiellaceae bacterium]